MDADRKQALRAAALDARRRLDPEVRSRAARVVTSRLLALPRLRGARTIVVYAATPLELNLESYVVELRRRGVRTLVPRVVGDDLEVAAYERDDDLRPGHRGVREPGGASVPLTVLDAVIVPAVAFDPRGRRLGHGGGHYDRLLGRLPDRVRRIGAAFACQIVPTVPVEPHDQPVELVVTESGVYRRDAQRTGR